MIPIPHTPETLARKFQCAPRTVRRHLSAHFADRARPGDVWMLTSGDVLKIGYALSPIESQSRRGSMMVRR